MNEEKKGYKGGGSDAARMLKEIRTGIVLSGRVVNGKVELDQSTMEEISKKYANAEISFVAVNAPFDPQSRAIVD